MSCLSSEIMFVLIFVSIVVVFATMLLDLKKDKINALLKLEK